MCPALVSLPSKLHCTGIPQSCWTHLCLFLHLGPLPEPFTNGEIQKVRAGPLIAPLAQSGAAGKGWKVEGGHLA